MNELLKDKEYLWLFCYAVEVHRTMHNKSELDSYRDIRNIFMPKIQSHWLMYTHDYDLFVDAIAKTFNSSETINKEH